MGSMRLAGKVSVVTGAASGIGRSVALRFAGEGSRVVLVDIREPEGGGLGGEIEARGGKASFERCDVGSEAQVREMFTRLGERFGRVDVLVNSAGVNVSRDVLEATDDEWRHVVAVDLEGAWHCGRHAVPLMRPGSSIVNVGSMHAIRTTRATFPYSVVKAGLLGLTRAMAIDLGRRGIRVNAVCPGLIETPMSADWVARMKREGGWDRILESHPLGRTGSPEDVAGAVLFLASEDSGFITGISLFVDGGRHALTYG